MLRKKATYDKFAKQYSQVEGNKGDLIHQTQIDPFVYKIAGDAHNKTVYDIGCGNGYMARHFAKEGAQVFASDASKELIKEAQGMSEGFDIHYAVHDATNFKGYEPDSFDVITMNMVIHYIKDLDKLFQGISKILKPNGIFVFSTNHFFRPAYPYSDWMLGKLNEKEVLFDRVTGYLKKEKREVISFWDNKTKMTTYNHPLNELVNTMAKHNLFTCAVEEPESGNNFATAYLEKLKGTHYIPTFIILGAAKRL